MQTAAASATIAATSYTLAAECRGGAAKAGEEISLRAVPDTRVESNVPVRSLIADGAAALARICRAAQIRRLDRDRADRAELGHDLELVAHLLERAARRRWHRLFDDHDVGRGLLVNSWLGDSADCVEMERENVERDLQDSADDGWAAGAAGRHHRHAFLRDDYRRHRREWALARPHLVGALAFEVVRVRHSRRDGEIVHLIVKDDAERGHAQLGAEHGIDGGSDRDDVAVFVRDQQV